MVTGKISRTHILRGVISNGNGSGATDNDHIYTVADYVINSIELTPEYSEIRYTQLSELTFDGTQYVEATGFIPSDSMIVEADFMRNATSNYAFVFGSRSGSSANDGLALAYNPSSCYPIFGSAKSSINNAASTSAKHTAIVGQSGYYLDGTPTKSYDSMSFEGSYDLLFGAINNGGSVDNKMFNGKIYEIKIYNNNELIAEFIPAQRESDGAAGMLDVISGGFYPQQSE